APGAGSWQLKYRPAGSKEGTTKTIGTYPPMSINKARAVAEDTRAAIPTAAPALKPARPASALTFGEVGREFIVYARGRDGGPPSRGTIKRRTWLFDKLGKLHSRPLTGITRTDILPLLESVQAEGRLCAGKDMLCLARGIFDHAQRHGIDYNPCARTKGWLIPYRAEHHAAITDPKGFGRLAALVDSWGDGSVASATQLLMRTVVRPGELRAARWTEFHDLDKPELARFEIPAERMKMKRPHVVPLSAGALAVLKLQARVSPPSEGGYIFPNARVPGECMSTDSM